ncbi:MAG: class I tRNA ligase family protein, partial [bacterium]|nr:class I tRNA ligase family protein [bacterium]
MDSYNPQKIEAKWRKIWEKNKTFQVDLKRAKSPYYNLMMFPYPSAEGLHVGNVYAFTGSDIHGRFKKMQGNDVFEPMGFDAFGIHSENFAIKKGIHPKILIKKNTDNFREQLKNLGGLFDWSHEVDTTKPEYYKWTQWLFLQLFKAGLAFRKKAPVDWCPSCKTVLADEQVISGKCERCDSQVIQKETEQWFFKITKYAEKLLKNLEKIDWSERTKIAQKNWIGKSEGAKIEFRIKNLEFRVEVFTTRPDTLFGCTYLVISPEHSMVQNIESRIKNIEEVQNYIKEAKRKSELERTDLAKEKTGVELKGIRAINPANNEEIPVFVADYVLASYGTGAIMAVPAHDQRDFEFAEKFKLKVVQVIAPLLKTTEGSDAVREDKKTEKRNTIYAFVKHWKEDKYLCLNWPKYNWHSSIIGGIEGGEDAMRAGLREIKEETGYKNVKLVKKLNTEIHSYYYAGHKEVNRYSIGYCGLYQLVDDQREEPDPEDIKNHETIWIDGKKMSEFLNLNNNILMWQMLMSGNDCFAGNGILINSGKFNEKDSETVKGEIIKSVGGKKTINYHLRDWLISRQRYWGPPIPIIYCKKCGTVPVPEKDLPVLLPFVKNFRPKNTGESPLASVPSFVKTKCPQCKGPAKRETDVSDSFLDSSWYFFRYPSTDFKNKPFDEIITKKWLPVDMYIGGQEHAVLHLLYTRFITMALKDAGFIDF